MFQINYNLPKEALAEKDGNYHIILFNYNNEAIKGHFAVSNDYVYMCILNDIAPRDVINNITKSIENGIKLGECDIDAIIEDKIPSHKNSLFSMMREIEEAGLPSDKRLVNYLKNEQGKKLTENLYKK